MDGFNTYYGALKARPAARWLDLVALARLLRPADTVDAVRYFSARVMRDQDPTAPGRQKLYLAALGTLPEVSVHFGQFRTHPVAMPLADPGPGKRRTVRVLKTEEKGSDVNLATALLLDGLDGLYEAAVVISDDSDLEAPIREANQRFGPVHVVSPRGASSTPTGPKAPYVMSHTGFSWTPLKSRLLFAAQLPTPLTLPSVARITGRRRGLIGLVRPCPFSDLLQRDGLASESRGNVQDSKRLSLTCSWLLHSSPIVVGPRHPPRRPRLPWQLRENRT